MKKTKKAVSAVMTTALVGAIIAGCSSGGDTPPAASSSPGASSTPKANEERLKMTMFYNEAGIKTPTAVDRSNNPLIKIVEDLANVDLEFDIPPYAEYTTKHNLVLASGKLPDIF